jgi:hypothetical protein
VGGEFSRCRTRGVAGAAPRCAGAAARPRRRRAGVAGSSRAAPPAEAVWVPERGARIRVRVGEAVRGPHCTPAGAARGEQLGGARHGQGRVRLGGGRGEVNARACVAETDLCRCLDFWSSSWLF